MTADTHTVEMEHEKSTKNTHKYTSINDGQAPAVTDVYVQKWALGEEPPERITLTVEPDDG